MKTLWRRLSNSGVITDQPYVLVRRIRLQNQVSLLFILFLLFFCIVNIFNNKLPLSVFEFVFALLLLLPIQLNREARYAFSSVVFYFLLYSLVLSVCFVLAPHRELEYLLLILAVVPLTSFRSKRIIYSFFLLSFALFNGAKIYVYGVQDIVTYLNYALIFMMTFFMVKYLKDEFEENADIIGTQNDQLKKLNEEKNQLISIASHDLRSPLNRIQSLLSLLALEGSLTPEQKTILQSTQREAKQQSEMITEILDVYALDEGRKTITLAPTHVQELTQELVKSFQPVAHKKSIIIQTEDRATAHHAMADRSLLKQVLENLFSNAIKFSYPNTTITVLLRSTVHTIIMSVKDQGQGLDAEDQKKLFKRFQKLSAKPTAGEATSGLGLSIAKKYTEAMKGSLTCVSEKGKGATFTVELPIA